MNQLEEKYDVAIAKKHHLEEELKELSISNDYLQGLLKNEADLYLFDPELVESAMNLTNFKVGLEMLDQSSKRLQVYVGKYLINFLHAQL